MSGDAYELLALLMRYVFVLLGALMLFRAYRWMRRDAKNYRREMRSLPDAGLIGEIVDLRTGKSQPLPREGDMGASRECDIFVKGSGVTRHHVRFAFEEGKGVLITPSRRGKTQLAGREMRAPGYALHGTQLQLGQVPLRVRLFAGLKVPQYAAYQQEVDAASTPEPGLASAYPEEEAENGCFPGGPPLPAPFDFSGQADATAQPPAASWQQDLYSDPAAAYMPQGQAAPAAAENGYDGHYTPDGQMTWQYAYSMEDLYRAQAALQTPPERDTADEENDEALPYQSPVQRRSRRRSRR